MHNIHLIYVARLYGVLPCIACRWHTSCRQEWQECEVAETNRYKLATWKFYYCLKWSCYLQNIFVNPCEFLGLCWVVFRSRNFADAKRKEVVCITLGFFQILLVGMGFRKKMGWEMGLVPPLQEPPLAERWTITEIHSDNQILCWLIPCSQMSYSYEV